METEPLIAALHGTTRTIQKLREAMGAASLLEIIAALKEEN